VALAYTENSRWRNRAEFFTGREAIVAFLRRKWARELDYRLIKELWAFTDNRIAVRSSTNGTTIPATGSVHTLMSSGSLQKSFGFVGQSVDPRHDDVVDRVRNH
jgi:Protein of unknown function (DUF1348)